jgi:hypothetical protein
LFISVLEVDHFHTKQTTNNNTNNHQNQHASPPVKKKRTLPFEVFVTKDTFKFNAAISWPFAGFRERLHGHNYRVSVRLLGERQIGADGYAD